MKMRWPWMTKKRHDKETALLHRSVMCEVNRHDSVCRELQQLKQELGAMIHIMPRRGRPVMGVQVEFSCQQLAQHRDREVLIDHGVRRLAFQIKEALYLAIGMI